MPPFTKMTNVRSPSPSTVLTLSRLMKTFCFCCSLPNFVQRDHVAITSSISAESVEERTAGAKTYIGRLSFVVALLSESSFLIRFHARGPKCQLQSFLPP